MTERRPGGQQRTPFLAVHDVPAGQVADALTEAFQRVARAASERGIKAIVTFYSPSRRRAYTYFEDDSAEHVRRACEAAGLVVIEVVHGASIGEHLMDEPQRT